jgi:FkbM family methyltransferase
MGKKIVQIGANRGYDDLTELVSNLGDLEFLLLVEPNHTLNANLMQCYKDYNYKIENVVITPNKDKTIETFYFCELDLISSLSMEHIAKHKVGQPTHKVEYPAITINALFDKYEITEVDILFIDAEGFDDQIIYSLDFDRFNIKELYYEHIHIDNTKIEPFLESKGYYISKGLFKDGFTNKAVKII